MLTIDRWNLPTMPDQEELRGRLEAEGYTVYLWGDPPGRTYAPHAHDEDQSHWIVCGALAISVDGEEYVLTSGDRDYLPAGTVHSARVVGGEEVVYLIGARS
jgi:quercetin dioxygenase-like cupin family protein